MREKININNKWIYENGFYLTSDKSRIGKLLAQYEIFIKTQKIKGTIVEIGVFKGASLMRLSTFRDLLGIKKKIIAFDAFGKFPKTSNKEINVDNENLNDDAFIDKFENESGVGISKGELLKFTNFKNISNLELIKGDIFKTLKKYYSKKPYEKISLLHIDVDTYAGTEFILNSLYNRVSKGGIIMFDNYNNIPNETAAVNKFFGKKIKKLKNTQLNKTPYYFVKE